jgi:pantetheine-phosphate adenylyltransferase
MKRIAIYPGSFDPVTRGHEDIVRRSLHLADRLIVAVAANQEKEPLFTIEERVGLLERALADLSGVEVSTFDGLLAEFAREQKAHTIIRGLRAFSDFDYESQMALMNRQLYPELETVFLVPALHLTYLSSSLVREVARLGGDVSSLVHPAVDEALQAKLGK